MLFKDLKDKHLGFIENINENQEFSKRVEVTIEPLDTLLKQYDVIPNTKNDLNVLKKVSELSLLDEDGWIREDSLGIKNALLELTQIMFGN